MKRMHWLVVAGLGVLGACSSTERTTGTSDETHTESLARIVLPDGVTPASGAVVTVTPRESIQSVASGQVDASGNPVVTAALPDGAYTVVVKQGSLTLLLDSLPAVNGKLVWKGQDTLEPSGNVRGVVVMEPQDDPATVTVNLLGTEIYANVDHDGSFNLSGVASGRLRMRFLTTVPNYTTTYVTTAFAPKVLNLSLDTVRMVYTGIPVVMGLGVKNDSLTGDLLLSWSAVKYGQLASYVIFRDTAGSLSFSGVPFAAVTGNSWRDTLAKSEFERRAWRYRVAVRTQKGVLGDWYGSVEGISVPPALAHLDAISWKEIARGSVDEIGVLAGKLADEHRVPDFDSLRLGVRTTGDGIVLDSVTLSLPSTRFGREIHWATGFGAGKYWAFGHSLLGDGVYFARSDSGKVWDSAGTLPDSLWPETTDSLRVWDSGNRLALVARAGAKSALLSMGGKDWIRQNLSGNFLGLSDSGWLSDGGGLHLLLTSWGGTHRDLGAWTASSALSQGTLGAGTAVISQGRLWVRNADAWELRTGTNLTKMTWWNGKLHVQDAAGHLWQAGEFR
jgi:hypothetical protein